MKELSLDQGHSPNFSFQLHEIDPNTFHIPPLRILKYYFKFILILKSHFIINFHLNFFPLLQDHHQHFIASYSFPFLFFTSTNVISF